MKNNSNRKIKKPSLFSCHFYETENAKSKPSFIHYYVSFPTNTKKYASFLFSNLLIEKENAKKHVKNLSLIYFLLFLIFYVEQM